MTNDHLFGKKCSNCETLIKTEEQICHNCSYKFPDYNKLKHYKYTKEELL